MLASPPAIPLACNSHFCDSILTLINNKPLNPESRNGKSLKNLKNTNHMKTTTALSASQNAEVAFGWNAMPAYGEVMNQLVGMNHTNVTSTLKLNKTPALTSLWSLLSSRK